LARAPCFAPAALRSGATAWRFYRNDKPMADLGVRLSLVLFLNQRSIIVSRGRGSILGKHSDVALQQTSFRQPMHREYAA